MYLIILISHPQYPYCIGVLCRIFFLFPLICSHPIRINIKCSLQYEVFCNKCIFCFTSFELDLVHGDDKNDSINSKKHTSIADVIPFAWINSGDPQKSLRCMFYNTLFRCEI